MFFLGKEKVLMFLPVKPLSNITRLARICEPAQSLRQKVTTRIDVLLRLGDICHGVDITGDSAPLAVLFVALT